MIDEHLETRAAAGTGPFEHLAVAVRVAERRVRTFSDEEVDADGFAVVVVVEEQFRLAHQNGLAVHEVIPRLDARTDDLLGRNAVHALCVDADELLTAARYDIRLESVRAQVVHRLAHRLVDELGVQALKARVPGRRNPCAGDLEEGFGAHAGVGRRDDLRPIVLG